MACCIISTIALPERMSVHHPQDLNTLRPRQNGRHFPDAIFKCVFLNENIWISIKFSLKFVPRGPINNIPALVQRMAWCRPGDKPLSEPTLVSLLTHKRVTQWVNSFNRNTDENDQIIIYCSVFIHKGISKIIFTGLYFQNQFSHASMS